MFKKYEPLTESYFYILLCLYDHPNHGYGIMQRTAELSQGNVKIGSGTMYGATGNMMKKGWIRETLSDNPDDKRKRLYELTDSGGFRTGNPAFKASGRNFKKNSQGGLMR